MASTLYMCLDCKHFDHKGFLSDKSNNVYDYECPKCGSKKIEVDYENEDDTFTEVESTNWNED